MALQEVEVVIGIELNALAFVSLLRAGIDPLVAVLEKRAAVHELRLLRVLGQTLCRRSSGCSRPGARDRVTIRSLPAAMEAGACSAYLNSF